MHPALVVYRPIRMANNPSSVPHPAPEAEEIYRRWLRFLDEEFTRHHSPERRSEIVSDQLYQLYSLFAGEAQREEMAATYRRGGFGYGEVKEALAGLAADFFAAARQRRANGKDERGQGPARHARASAFRLAGRNEAA